MHLAPNITQCFASVMWALGIFPWDDLNLDQAPNILRLVIFIGPAYEHTTLSDVMSRTIQPIIVGV